MASTIEIFLSYAHAEEDESVLKRLLKHLGALKRQGFFRVWYDCEISAGMVRTQEIDQHLNGANIILLLISPDFLDSDYCYSVEMKRALERHERGEARVIPIIVRPVYWQRTPFSMLQPLPKNSIPIMDAVWRTLDEAIFDVAEGIRKAAEELS